MGVDIGVIFLWKHREQIYVGVPHDWQGWKTNLLLYGFLHYPPWKEELCPHRYLPLEASVKIMLSFVGQKRCFQVSLESHVCQPSQSGQRSRQELRQRHWTSSLWFQSGVTFTFQMGMIEFHNSIIYIPTLLDQRHRGRGLQIFGELPRENEGPATVIRNILALLFLRRNQMIELNQISVTNRSYCNTSRKNLVDNASCVWIVVLLQNIDDLIVHIY